MPNNVKKTTPIIPSALAAFFSLTLIVLSNTIQTPFKNVF
ncbi:putative membrane protein [Helicobacter pylori Hp P-3]|nr:putative membrane protein [Helicobacter pylori Hp P-3]